MRLPSRVCVSFWDSKCLKKPVSSGLFLFVPVAYCFLKLAGLEVLPYKLLSNRYFFGFAGFSRT